MSDKESAKSVIDSYRKRQNMAQKAPLIFGLAAVLLIIGAGAIIYWATGNKQPGLALFATQTPTPTFTPTVTLTPVPTDTPTPTSTFEPTNTPTPTLTSTPSGPFVYIVQEGDGNLTEILKKFGLEKQLLVVKALNPSLNLDLINVGQEIILPAPDTRLPTATPLPTGFTGTIDYTVQQGDSLLAIAENFNTTVDAILKANPNTLKTKDDVIYPGMALKIPANIVTPRPTATQGTKYPTAPIPASKTPTPTPTAKP